MPNISKINALAIGSVAKVDGLAKASILDIDGVAVPPAVSAPAAAYSVRLLGSAVGISSYTGDCMRVRRASDNVEADVGFDAGELKLTSPISNTSDAQSYTDFADFVDHTGTPTSAFVRYWYDQSGNANDAGQATAGSQPQIYNSATGLIEDGSVGNEKPALNFDGSDNFYASGVSLANSLDAFFVSHKNSTVRQAYYAFDATANTNYVRQEAGDPATIFAEFTDWGGSGSFLSITSQANNQNQILVNNFSESGSQGYQINGSSIGTDTDVYTPTAPMTGLYIAVQNNGANDLIGTMQEFVLFSSVQSSSNRTGIETDINGFFSIY